MLSCVWQKGYNGQNMTERSCRQRAETVTISEKNNVVHGDLFGPMVVVGAAAAAALTVLMLLTQSQLSQLGFEISALEQELEQLDTQHEKLLVSHAMAYSPDRIEDYAINELGMIHPNPDQIRYIDIDTVDRNRKEPEE